MHSVTRIISIDKDYVRGEVEAHHEKRGPRWYDRVTILDIFYTGTRKADGDDGVEAEDFSDQCSDI
jgi:hypothetical protein